MAKIYTDEEICYLRENPNVRVIKRDRLILTYEFRCHLYDAYMANGRYPDVTVGSALKELGVDPDLVFLETIGDSTFHLLQCAEERILWSCPGKDTSDQSEASRFGQR